MKSALNDTKRVLAYAFTVGFFVTLWLKIFFHVDEGIITALVGLEGIILGFYFGSSESSRHKDTLLSERK
jgi:apolipoprotein N-acyltransferase